MLKLTRESAKWAHGGALHNASWGFLGPNHRPSRPSDSFNHAVPDRQPGPAGAHPGCSPVPAQPPRPGGRCARGEGGHALPATHDIAWSRVGWAPRAVRVGRHLHVPAPPRQAPAATGLCPSRLPLTGAPARWVRRSHRRAAAAAAAAAACRLPQRPCRLPALRRRHRCWRRAPPPSSPRSPRA